MILLKSSDIAINQTPVLLLQSHQKTSEFGSSWICGVLCKEEGRENPVEPQYCWWHRLEQGDYIFMFNQLLNSYLKYGVSICVFCS